MLVPLNSIKTGGTQRLITAALDGDLRAQRQLFERALPPVQRSVARALFGRLPRVARDGLRAEAADLVGSVWVALLENGGKRLRAWDPDRAPFDRFIEMVARHHVYAFLRAEGRSWSREVPWADVDIESLRADEHETPEQCVERVEFREAVLAAVELSLSAEALVVFELLVRQGLTVPEVSERTGLSENAIHVKSHRFRKAGREAARRLLNSKSADY